jgi:HK97 family phage major capsid protein
MIQKLLDSIQSIQGNLDSRLAALEKHPRADELEEKLRRLDGLVTSVDELKAVLRGGGFGNDRGAYEGHFPSERHAKGFGLLCLAAATKSSGALDRLADLGFKAMAEGVNSTGGALVPQEFIGTIIRLAKAYGRFRQGARVVPMSTDLQTWPKLSGTLSVYCPGEAGTITASNPTFENVSLAAKKFATLSAISSELFEDAAVEIGELLAEEIGRGFARTEDQVGFLGDGTSTYFGCTGIAGALRAVDSTIGNIKSLVVGSGNQYSELVLGDFDEAVGKFPDFADQEGEVFWYMSRGFYWNVVVPLIEAHSSGVPTIGQPADIADAKTPRLRGYPVKFVNVMPSTEANSQICALLANLRMGCYLGNRRDIRIDQSKDVYFTSDQVGIRGTIREAINCFGVGDTTDEGPVMGLITAAS